MKQSFLMMTLLFVLIGSTNANDPHDKMLELLNSCTITLTSSQNTGNCNGECYGPPPHQPCGEITVTIHGIYGCEDFYTDLDGFDFGGWECNGPGSGTWNSTPSYTTMVSLCGYAHHVGGSGPYYMPVTLNYTYTCGGSTCSGSVSSSVKFIVC